MPKYIVRPSFVRTERTTVHISAALWGGPAHESVTLCVGAAYELGRELVDHAEALLAGEWEADGDRTHSHSRPSRRGGAGRQAEPGAADGSPARARPSGNGYPRARRRRPGPAVDSGA